MTFVAAINYENNNIIFTAKFLIRLWNTSGCIYTCMQVLQHNNFNLTLLKSALTLTIYFFHKQNYTLHLELL